MIKIHEYLNVQLFCGHSHVFIVVGWHHLKPKMNQYNPHEAIKRFQQALSNFVATTSVSSSSGLARSRTVICFTRSLPTSASLVCYSPIRSEMQISQSLVYLDLCAAVTSESLVCGLQTHRKYRPVCYKHWFMCCTRIYVVQLP